ncbi:TetR/AcrR family transcriptional regulator [Nitrososphaera sp.]|uniref:TetR/AcrR family transcriptional regulator n=1 Tax=Nitrososphaera sp. TaxID=1971748 RepID=UPI00307F2255
MHKAEVRDRIIHAAIESFSQAGFDRTKMDDIARRIGLSKGTLYLYFKSKEDLFIAISEHYINQLREPLDAEAPTREDLVADAEQFYETFRKIGRPGDDRVIFEMLVESTRNPRLKKAMHEHRLRVHGVIVSYLQRQVERGFFRSDIDIDSLAWAFMSAWVGLTIYKLCGVSEPTVKKAWASMMRAAYAGMG